MQDDLNNALKRQFGRRLAEYAYDFSQLSGRLAHGRSVFVKPAGFSSTRLFIILYPDTKGDAFTLEIGWTARQHFPEALALSRPTPSRAEFKEQDFACRLGGLFAQSDYWWFVRPDFNPLTDDLVAFVKDRMERISPTNASALVSPPVEDAVQKLVSHGLPYLNEYLTVRRSQ